MLNRELTLYFNQKPVILYLLDGFFHNKAYLSNLHNHPFAEIQLVVSGSIQFSDLRNHFFVQSGQMIVLPAECFHESTYMEPDTQIITFLVELATDKCEVISLPSGIPSLLLEEVKHYHSTGESVKLPFYLSLIVSEIIKEGTDPALPIQNRSFIIHDFFSLNFAKDVTVSDIANILCMSNKQTERLIKQYTGNTFRQEIVRLRMEAAEQLIATTDLTMTEIAEKVGYQSYSGFWKAYNAFKASSMTTKA